jgi:formylmethanofuran dehydrogenase subunit C
MSMTLTLHTPPSVPIEAEAISPDRLQGLSETEVAALPVLHGNRRAELGDFFHVKGSCDGELRLEGNLERVKLIGCGMTSGRIIIDGNAGMHLGAAMRGGQIEVEGNASDWAGAEMLGGRIIVKGDAGHLLGSAYRGNRVGMLGGEIIIHGKAGNEIGNAMRRGLIAVGGSTGDFTGVNLLAGTIIVLGELGWRSGASMKRGTIVSMQDARILPTFNYAGTYQPVFLRMYLLHLRRLGLPVEDIYINGQYRRWSGDGIELNRGEILLLQG